jgi:hypothetical protein
MPSAPARASATATCIVAVILVCGLISLARAASVITYASALTDVGSGWLRSSTVSRHGLGLEENSVIGNDR